MTSAALLTLTGVAIAATGSIAVSFVSAAPERPTAVQALERRGVTMVGRHAAPGGRDAWAGFIDQRPLALFESSRRQAVRAGNSTPS